METLDVNLSRAKFSSIYFSCMSALTNPNIVLSWAFSSSLVDIKICQNQSKLVSANQRNNFYRSQIAWCDDNVKCLFLMHVHNIIASISNDHLIGLPFSHKIYFSHVIFYNNIS